MKLYKVEKGIKVPPPQPRGGIGTSKAVATMAVLAPGDSFLIKDALESVKAEKLMRDLNSRERQNGGGRNFVSRRIKQGLRIWRVK